ncbi:MAG: DUF3667 domain-containing protein [Armatimonadota bacterium]
MQELPTACLNCTTPFADPTSVYCPKCGQENQPRVLPFSTVVREACAEFVQIDGKLARTFWALLFRPGFLTNEFVQGRRIRFLSPLKMYLFTSASFFLIFSLLYPVTGNDIENFLQRRMREENAGKPVPRSGVTVSTRTTTARATVRGTLDKTKWVNVPPFPMYGQTIDIQKLPASVFDYREVQDQRARTGQPTDPPLMQAVKRKLIRLRESPGDAIRAIAVGTLSNMTLFAVPLLALFMLPLYLRRNKRLYIEHFVFQLHCHTFFFVVLTLVSIVNSVKVTNADNYANLLLLWLPVYGAFALRRVYGQRWGKSLLKAFLMLNVYGVILAFAALLGVVVTLISILITL